MSERHGAAMSGALAVAKRLGMVSGCGKALAVAKRWLWQSAGRGKALAVAKRWPWQSVDCGKALTVALR